jgi:hypothetical protein
MAKSHPLPSVEEKRARIEAAVRPDLDARAARAKQIAEELYGRALWRDGAKLHVEIPADMAGPPRPVTAGADLAQSSRAEHQARGAPDKQHAGPYGGDRRASLDGLLFVQRRVDAGHAVVEDKPSAAIAATRPVKPA